MKNPTILDVAKLAYVSRSTAALALSKRSDKVNPDTRRRVLAAAEELGYRANPAGKALRTGGGREVAFIYHELSDFEMEHGAGPMWARFAMLLGMDLGRAGCRLFMLPKSAVEAEPHTVSAVLAFADRNGHAVLPDLPYGTPVWVATPADSDIPYARITHDFTAIATQVLDFVQAQRGPVADRALQIGMCVRGVVDPPFTHAMEAALRQVGQQREIDFIVERVDPRDADGLVAFDTCSREAEMDAVFYWGLCPTDLPEPIDGATRKQPLILAFCENELTNFPPQTPYVSFRLDDAARQVACAVAKTVDGSPIEDITLTHTFSH